MAAPISVTALTDLVTTTLADLGKFKWTDYASQYQSYPVGKKIIKKKRRNVESGKSIQWNVDIARANLSKAVGLFAPNDYFVPESMIQATIPWRFFNTSMVIETREVAMNTGAAQIVSLLKLRRAKSMASWIELVENLFWTSPTAVTGLEFFGITYWVTSYAGDGFSGANHSLYAAGPGGISRTTYTAHKNYTVRYVNVDATFLDQIRTMLFSIDWEPPVDIPEYGGGVDADFEVYCGFPTKLKMIKLAESRNDNLGWSFDNSGRLLINRAPVTAVPALGSTSGSPIYFLNWTELDWSVLEGQYMVQNGPKEVPGYSTAVGTNWDTTMNLRCTNCRKQAVATTA